MSAARLGVLALGLLALTGLVTGLGGCGKAKVVITESTPPTTDTPASSTSDPLVEQEAIRETIRRYDAALVAREPAAASECVVEDTFAYYEDLRIAALRATREQLDNNWDLMSVILILQVRTKIMRPELEAMDGRALFEQGVRDGLVGQDVSDIALDEIWIDDDGHAEVRVEGSPVVWLRKTGEGDAERWRVDIPEMIRLLGPAVEAMVEERVVADGKVRTALTFVELSSDEFVDIAVLDGPLDGPPEGSVED